MVDAYHLLLQVMRRRAPCCAVPGCACAAQLRHAAGAAAAADTEKWSLEAMGFGPIELFDFLYSQLQQASSPYNQKKSKPRFGGDGLKMAKCLLRDGSIYAELHGMLALHGGANAPQPISTADAQRVRTKPGPKPKMLDSLATAGARIFGRRSGSVEAGLRAELASAREHIEALEAQHSEALNILSPAILRKLAVRSE